jgi:hypothetical protein
MVRPRASKNNLSLALKFSKMIILPTETKKDKGSERVVLVACSGPLACYAAFAACFPDLVRDSDNKRPRNRQGVTCVELNKAMKVVFHRRCSILKIFALLNLMKYANYQLIMWQVRPMDLKSCESRELIECCTLR